MRIPSSRTSLADRKLLRQFLDGPQRKPKHLTYHQLQGFLFALAAGPDLVMPSEWVTLVFGDDGAEYKNLAEARRVMAALMAWTT